MSSGLAEEGLVVCHILHEYECWGGIGGVGALKEAGSLEERG